MSISHEDLTETLRRISLSGRLDIVGTGEISTKFAGLISGNNRRVIVDISAVSFLASIGIREFISNAKAIQQRGGKMVLFVGDNEVVTKTLHATGIDALLPMFADEAEAKEAVLA